MRPRGFILVATVMLGLSLATCGGRSAPGSSRISLKIGYASPSILHGPMWIAKEAGYFEQRGMDVDLQYIGPGQPIISAVLQGDVALATDAAGQRALTGRTGVTLRSLQAATGSKYPSIT